jgi:hypothetical protein
MQLDIPTVIVVEILASAMSALVLAASLRGTPGPGAREATAAMACLEPGFLLYLLRARMPEAASILGANLLFWTTALLVHRAVTRFASDRPPARWPISTFCMLIAPWRWNLATRSMLHDRRWSGFLPHRTPR